MKSFFDMAILLIPLGCVVGLWIEVFSLKSMHMYQPIVGPLVGMTLAAILCLGCRNLHLKGFCKRATLGILLGTVSAVLIGVPVYQSSKVSSALKELKAEDPSKYGFVVNSTAIYSYSAYYQRDGVLFCVPLGFAVGFLAAVAFQGWCALRDARPGADTFAATNPLGNIPTGS